MNDKDPSDPTARRIREIQDSLTLRYSLVDLDNPPPISISDLEMITAKSKMMARRALTVLAHTPNADRDPFAKVYSTSIREHADNAGRWATPQTEQGPVTTEVTKPRPESQTLKFEVDWGVMSNPRQAIGRVLRHRMVNAVVLPGPHASRNEREGHYDFKVKGRHTRKRRKTWPKIITMRIGDKFWESIEGRLEKKKEQN